MKKQTLDHTDTNFSDRDLGINFIVDQGLIRVHTDLTYTAQLSTVVSVNANYQWNIGRSNRCTIIIDDSTISRQHAVLGYDHHAGFYIMDCASYNGTFLNQIRLIPLKRYLLRDLDLLAISGQTIQINISHKDLEL
jgi:pSer/pThr/pTyr-binding forkhead associated (FHA) protein